MGHQNKKNKTFRYFSFLFFFFFIIFLQGCGGSKRLGREEAFEVSSFNTFFDDLSVIEMKGKLKITMDGSGTSYSANTTVRMAGDSIWMIGRFIGIEVFRALVTPEAGIQVINRAEKTYLTAGWDEIQQKYKNQDLTYSTFRNLVLGNPFLVRGANYNFYKNKKTGIMEYDLKSGGAQLLIDIIVQKKLRQSSWVLENDQIAIEAKYDQYDSPTLKNIPYFRNYIAYFHNTQPINIELTIKNFSFNDQITLPFQIPDHYSRNSLLAM